MLTLFLGLGLAACGPVRPQQGWNGGGSQESVSSSMYTDAWFKSDTGVSDPAPAAATAPPPAALRSRVRRR